MKKVSLLLLVLLVCAGCATMGDNRGVMLDSYKMGKEAYENGDYSQAFSLLQPAAQAGNPNAQYYLAIMYDFGRGTDTNHEEANVWYLKAAQQGQDDAQFNLAISYKTGEGIETDDEQAMYWLSKSAANGDEDAMYVLTRSYADNPQVQYNIAQIYRNGVTLHNDTETYPNEEDNINIAPDMEKYRYWLQQAADNGFPGAAEELAAIK